MLGGFTRGTKAIVSVAQDRVDKDDRNARYVQGVKHGWVCGREAFLWLYWMDKVGSTASLDPSRSTRPTNQRRVQPRVVIVATPRERHDWALSNTTARLYLQDTHNWTEATWLYANVPQAMNELLLYPFAIRFGSLQDLSDLFQGWGHGIIGVARAAGIIFP
jgi:hypothetical protein